MAISKFHIPNFLKNGNRTSDFYEEKISINCNHKKMSTFIPSEYFVDLSRFNEMKEEINFKYNPNTG